MLRQDADGMLRANGWKRRCVAEESGGRFHFEPNLVHDDFWVFPVPRDGNCLFHCFATALVEMGLEHYADQVTMRLKTAQYFRANSNKVVCDSSSGGNNVTLSYVCENVDAIGTGIGGREAYGDTPELAALCKIYDVSATIYAPESAHNREAVTWNPGKRSLKLLQTLGWDRYGIRDAGTDHFQILKFKQEETQPAAGPGAAAVAAHVAEGDFIASGAATVAASEATCDHSAVLLRETEELPQRRPRVRIAFTHRDTAFQVWPHRCMKRSRCSDTSIREPLVNHPAQKVSPTKLLTVNILPHYRDIRCTMGPVLFINKVFWLEELRIAAKLMFEADCLSDYLSQCRK